MDTLSTSGLTKPEVLAALFNHAKPQGLGKLQYRPDHRMDSLEAGMVLAANGDDVDYMEGRVIKVRFDKPDSIDARLYDRDNGRGAAFEAIRYALDKKEGGFMGDLELPLRIGNSEIHRREHPGMVWYEYDNFMGGELRVFRSHSPIDTCSTYKVEYASRELDLVAGRSITEEYIGRMSGAVDMFKMLVRDVVTGFVVELLGRGDKDEEGNKG